MGGFDFKEIGLAAKRRGGRRHSGSGCFGWTCSSSGRFKGRWWPGLDHPDGGTFRQKADTGRAV